MGGAVAGANQRRGGVLRRVGMARGVTTGHTCIRTLRTLYTTNQQSAHASHFNIKSYQTPTHL